MPRTTRRPDARRRRALRRRSRAPWRIATAVFVAVFALGTSTWAASAGWTSASQSLGSGTVNAASAAVTATGTAPLSTGATPYRVPTSSPGNAASRVTTATVQNTGTTPLALSAALSNTNGTLAANIRITYWTSSSCALPVPAAGTGGATAALLSAGGPALPTALATLAAGASAQLCMGTTLTSTTLASQGQTVSFTLTITGTLTGTNWSGTSAAPVVTQAVFRVGSPGAVTCAYNSTTGVLTLSWPPGAGATGYRIVRGDNPSVVVKPTFTPTDPANPSTTVNGLEAGILSIGTVPVIVESVDATSATTNAGSAYTMNAVVVGLLGLRCGS